MTIPNPEEYQFEDNSTLHDYRTEIPNMIFAMGLDPWQFKAYCVIKWTAGDKRTCFKSNTTLACDVGCSIPTLIKIKKELIDLGLISIQKRKHENGSDLPDLIRVIDIWPQNMHLMCKMYPRNPEKDLKTWDKNKDSNINSEGKGDLGGGVNGVKGEGKRGLHKQDVIKQDVNKQQQQQDPVVVVSQDSKSVELLKAQGFDSKTATTLGKFPLERIERQIAHLKSAQDLLGVDNPLGWLRNAIEYDWQPAEIKEDPAIEAAKARESQLIERQKVRAECEKLYIAHEKGFTTRKYFDLGIDVVSMRSGDKHSLAPYDTNAVKTLKRFIECENL